MTATVGTTRVRIHEALKIIGITGLTGITIDAPTTAAALEMLGILDCTTAQQRNRLVQELRRQQLITESRDGHLLKLQLTIKGAQRLQRLAVDALVIPTPEVWDRRWRVVMFDIPSRHQHARYLLTSQLKRLGFSLVQGSVWVHPYPCLDIVEQTVAYTNLQPFVTLAEVSSFDTATERRLRRKWPEIITRDSRPL